MDRSIPSQLEASLVVKAFIGKAASGRSSMTVKSWKDSQASVKQERCIFDLLIDRAVKSPFIVIIFPLRQTNICIAALLPKIMSPLTANPLERGRSGDGVTGLHFSALGGDSQNCVDAAFNVAFCRGPGDDRDAHRSSPLPSGASAPACAVCLDIAHDLLRHIGRAE